MTQKGKKFMDYVQLIMRWENDGNAPKTISLSDGVTIETFPKRKSALDDWLDIIQYGLTDGRLDADCYKRCMTDLENYDEN